ncbi:MAG: 30S ribosomal protein S1 [Planctomycetota bacterium]|nr:MAG: 30S ribosomal protein S1 [Planctomycetota bacterium]
MDAFIDDPGQVKHTIDSANFQKEPSMDQSPTPAPESLSHQGQVETSANESASGSPVEPAAGRPAPGPSQSSAAPARPSRDATGAEIVAAMTAGADAALERELEAAMGGMSADEMAQAADKAPQTRDLQEDTLMTGRVANIGSQDVLIDFDGKSLGSMPLAEAGKDETCQVGDRIEVAVIGQDERLGLMIVSRKKARQLAALRGMQVGTVLQGVVTGMNKGGLEVDIDGLRGFIPASQVDVHFLKDISSLLGQTVRAEVTKFEPGEQNIVLSRRKVLLHEAEETKARMFAELEVGQLRRGKVKSLAEYGAFVDLGGIDGLLHVTDMSWGRVQKPEDVVGVGDEVEVKIIKIQRDKHKVSLSLKQAKPNPWTTVSERYNVGDKVSGRVVRMQSFGAFVELEPGIEALLPVSELSWTRRVRHPQEVVKEGDVVEVGIISIDAEKQRISLSLKALKGDPWSTVAERYAPGAKVKGKVVRTTEFGAFVELEEGIDGLMHISELSDQRVKAVTDKVKPGDEVEVRVIGVDLEKKKISLSMKPPPKEPTPEEIAAMEKERAAAEKRRASQKPRRGGITFDWDQGLGTLDPNKFARS